MISIDFVNIVYFAQLRKLSAKLDISNNGREGRVVLGCVDNSAKFILEPASNLTSKYLPIFETNPPKYCLSIDFFAKLYAYNLHTIICGNYEGVLLSFKLNNDDWLNLIDYGFIDNIKVLKIRDIFGICD